ncbi:MAG TPA: hypothetical protein VGX21_22595 [Methylomirabilota bacterium]|nr:hypothetical protein [Methylomirabilota bacterium]
MVEQATKRLRQIGSWSLYTDIAGQVSRNPGNPVVTVATVGIPKDLVRVVRSRLRRGFQGSPTKWKHGKLAGFQVVEDLVVAHRLQVGVLQIHCADPERWRSYYEQADRVAAEVTRRTGKPLPFLDGDTALRMFLFTQSSAGVVGRILRARAPWGSRAVQLELEMVVDTDLPTEDSRRWYERFVAEWPESSRESSRLITELNVHPVATARFQTEEQEPLLLLADYIAGLYQHADPRTALMAPVVSADAASLAVAQLRARHADRLYENPEEFEGRYPMVLHDSHVLPRHKADALGIE